MYNWRKLAAMVLAGVMIFALAACGTTTQTSNEAPTEAPTEASTVDPQAPTTEDGTVIIDKLLPTIDPETYKEFIYTWYADGSSASYRLNIKDDGTWDLTNVASEVVASGTLRMNEEDKILEMYDPDGSLAISATLEKEDTIHIELMLETLSDTLSTSVFLNHITNNISDAPPADVQDDTADTTTEEDNVIAPPLEDDTPIEATAAAN